MRQSDIVRRGQRGAPGPRPAASAAPPEAPARAASDLARPAAQPAPGAADAPRPRDERPGDSADLVFQRAVERIRQTLATRAQAPFSIGQAVEAVESLLQSLETSDALLMPFFRGASVEGSQARKAVDVTIVALKLGLELDYTRPALRELGLAALLCDIGTTLMPAEILAGAEPLSAAERSSLRGHQLEGARLLEQLAPEHRWLGEVIGRRYDRPEGHYQGRDTFDEYAAIVHLADIYRSLVHPRPARKRIGPLDALKEILQHHRAVFPDRILKALIRAMSTFPVGSLVRLNTGEIAQVVERNEDYPLRPSVEILVRRGKRLPEPARLDLTQNPLVYIKESVVEEEPR